MFQIKISFTDCTLFLVRVPSNRLVAGTPINVTCTERVGVPPPTLIEALLVTGAGERKLQVRQYKHIMHKT